MEAGILSSEDKRAMLAQLLQQRAAQPRRESLSRGQQRIWQLHELDPAGPVYNIGLRYNLIGPLDLDRLCDALKHVANRHESTRTSFEVIGGQPVQLIAPKADVRIDRIDLTHLTEPDLSTEVGRLALQEAQAAFSLDTAPLWRFSLLKCTIENHTLLLTTHHIVSDRWSVGLFVQEVAAVYEALRQGRLLTDDPAPGYADAMRRLETAIDDEQTAYWRSTFALGAEELILPTDRRPTAPSYRGHRHTFNLPAHTAQRINEIAGSEGVTPYVVLLSAMAVRLHAQSGQTDLLLISPVAGRHRVASRGVLGYFNNLLPLRIRFSPDADFLDLLRATDSAVRDAFSHPDVSFREIMELSNLGRINPARGFFALQNTTSLDLTLPGVTSTYDDVANQTANFDLALFVEEYGGTYRGFVDAKADCWTEAAVDRFVDEFLGVIRVVTDRPSVLLAEFRTGAIADGSGLTVESAGVPSTTRPQNELERRMIRLWEEVLGIRPIGPESNFFALGGHSILAARLFERIGGEIGRELPLASLLKAPTPRGLSDLLLAGDDAPHWAALVAIQPEGSKPPFFCVHGGGGGVLSYTLLAKYLGNDQPIFGLQIPKSNPDDPNVSVEQLAEHYLDAIREVRPAGPYHLGGHSFGGLVAYEMARRLAEAGETVAMLAIIDHPGPDSRVSLSDKVRWSLYCLAQLEPKQKVRFVLERVSWQIRRSKYMPTAVKRAAYKLIPDRAEASKAAHRLQAMNAAMSALQLYKVRPYPGPLTLFRAKLGSRAVNSDPFGGWHTSAGGGVDVHDIHCQHMDIFKEPHVAALAESLRISLGRAEA